MPTIEALARPALRATTRLARAMVYNLTRFLDDGLVKVNRVFIVDDIVILSPCDAYYN